MNTRLIVLALSGILSLLITGCETVDSGASGRMAMNEAIRMEPAGNYFVGRRMYKQDYKVWGWVREPSQPWKSAKLVMLNEQKTLAPDRAGGKIGTDNTFEYKLTGYFSGQTVYEPASNGFYPEFVLTGSELKSMSAPNIYSTNRQAEPSVRILQPPI